MNKYKQIVLLVLMTVLILNCSKKEPQDAITFKLHTADFHSQIDYKIYSFILKEHYLDSTLIIIKQKVDYFLAPIIYNSEYNTGDYYDYIKNNMHEIDTCAYLDFLNKNDTACYLDNLFTIPDLEVKLISEEEYNYFLDKGYNTWLNFYEKYPNSNGLIELSRIGFNYDSSQAILEIFHSIGWTGSSGFIYFLKKVNDTWIITDLKQTKSN